MFERFFDDLKDFFDDFSFLFNPFDPHWQGKDHQWLEEIKNYWSNFYKDLFNYYIYDPIVLDLDGNGITISQNNVYFDHNGDEVMFNTSWIDKNDALLVLDKNNNGIIDSGSELFDFNFISKQNLG